MAASKRTKRSKPSSPRPARPRSYTPLADALSQPHTFADTELAAGINRHGLKGLLAQALNRKRRPDGEPLGSLLCALLIWPLLKVSSIHCFCAELCQFLRGKVSVVYDFLGLEDINWRGFSSELARRVNKQNDLGPQSQRAFVVDDTSKARSGRKVEGSSSYYDHNQGRTRKGHQVLQLGISGEKGFLPVESQLIMGQKAAVDKLKPFQDERCSAARDLRRARKQSKHELFREMLPRALRAGFAAKYVLADAWFGCKENIEVSLEHDLIGIFQMKRGTLRYEYRAESYTACELYEKVRRQMRPKNKKARYKTASLIVKINLETREREPARWVKVRLVFSAPVRQTRSDTWVLFLCTDLSLREDQILKVYALRWSIEVYFKEIKQHLGFLKEQSGRYQLAYASVHLAAVRYLLLFEAMLRSGRMDYGEIRDKQTGHLEMLTYAGLMWQLFRALIDGALGSLVGELGRATVHKVASAIDQTVESFLNEALLMKPEQVSAQLKAEKLGYL
jgi:hypothetical protein